MDRRIMQEVVSKYIFCLLNFWRKEIGQEEYLRRFNEKYGYCDKIKEFFFDSIWKDFSARDEYICLCLALDNDFLLRFLEEFSNGRSLKYVYDESFETLKAILSSRFDETFSHTITEQILRSFISGLHNFPDDLCERYEFPAIWLAERGDPIDQYIAADYSQ